MIAQKPFHWISISSDTGGLDDHRTIVGCGVQRMVINTMLSHIIHSSACTGKRTQIRNREICRRAGSVATSNKIMDEKQKKVSSDSLPGR